MKMRQNSENMTGSNDIKSKTGGSFIKGKYKRLSDAAKVNIPHKNEKLEAIKSQEGLILSGISSRHKHDNETFESDVSASVAELEAECEIKNEETSNMKKSGINKPKNVKHTEDTGKRKMYHGYEPECERLSEERKTPEITENNHVDQVNKTKGSNKSLIEHEKSINQKSSIGVPRLYLTNLYSETDSSDMSDTKEVDEASRKSVDTADSAGYMDNLNFISDFQHTCSHGNISFTPRKGEILHQSTAQAQKVDRASRKCFLCDIKGASIKNKSVQTDPDKLLSELIYPYEYYDRYSRENRTQTAEKAKEVIPICQQVKVIQKPRPPSRKSSPVMAVPTTTPVFVDLPKESPKRPVVKARETEDESPCSSEKKEKTIQYLYQPRENIKTEFHDNCGNSINALIITENTDGQKGTLRGMKGYYQQHKETKTFQKEVKLTDYSISSLGMQFSLPDYNTALRSRKEPIPRMGAQKTPYTPRFIEQYMPLSQPPTFRQSPKQHLVTFSPRDTYSNELHPQAPTPSLDDIVKAFDTNRSRCSLDFEMKPSVESPRSSRKQKISFSPEVKNGQESTDRSLPPIHCRHGQKRSTLTSGPITVGGPTS